MTLGWPGPILRQGHIWYFGSSVGKIENRVFFLKLLKHVTWKFVDADN